MILNIRRNIARQMFGNKKFLKALSLLLMYHKATGCNVCKKYSVNKIATITGLSHTTIRKRIQTLKEYSLVRIEGTSLVFSSITSRHRDRNERLDNVLYTSIKDIEKSLYATLLCIIQRRKDFIKRAILEANNSHNYKTIKRAKAIIRRYAKDKEFHDWGISYKTIAKKLGVSLKSAFEYVRYAILHKFIAVQRHFKSYFVKGINRYPAQDFTFTTKNYAYIVSANTYTIINRDNIEDIGVRERDGMD